jgi:hypothetical protein
MTHRELDKSYLNILVQSFVPSVIRLRIPNANWYESGHCTPASKHFHNSMPSRALRTATRMSSSSGSGMLSVAGQSEQNSTLLILSS